MCLSSLVSAKKYEVLQFQIFAAYRSPRKVETSQKQHAHWCFAEFGCHAAAQHTVNTQNFVVQNDVERGVEIIWQH